MTAVLTGSGLDDTQNAEIPDISAFDIMYLPKDFVPRAYSYFKALRTESSIHQNSDGSYIITRYDDLVAVYRNPAVWRSDKKIEFEPKFGASSLYEHHTTSLVFNDPPDHTRIRKLFQAAFTRKALTALVPRVHKLVDGYLDRLEDQGKMEIVADFSFRLPVEVVCDMLGVPSSDRVLIRDWASLILGALEPVLSEKQFKDGCDAVNAFKAYLRDRIRELRTVRDPGREGEILSALAAAEEDGEKLTEIELLHQCIFLLNAGHETSTNMLSHGVHEMLRHPDQFQNLRKDPTLIASAVEEILRYQAPIQINNRRAILDTELSGTPISAGTSVHLMIGAANHDPGQFPDPEIFDIARRPNRHLSFGLGIHICAGNTLARMEGEIAFGKLFTRFPGLRMEAPAELSNRVRFREISELHVSI